MSEYIIGEPINLAAMLKRNRFPWTGQSVTVRVVEDDGTEVLASTVVPETSEPGLHSYEWTNPPQRIATFSALFMVKTRCYTEEIKIVYVKSKPSQFDKTKVVVNSDNNLRAKINDEKIQARIVDDEIKVTINDEKIKGKLEQDTIIGVIK